MELLSEWNQTNAIPPWSDAELRHKLREAAKSVRQAGYLLAHNAPSLLCHPPALRPTPPPDEAARKAAQRQQWPAFRLGTETELRSLASLRRIHPGIPWLAQKEGLLMFTTSPTGEDCYGFTEGTMAQVRRMDGQPFTSSDGKNVKSRNLPGSVGSWLGYAILERHPNAPVLVGEGLVSWMEVMEALTRAGAWNWRPFAALSASVHLGERELSLLRGRQIIIARDRAEAGAAAAIRWQQQLATVNTTARIWTPPLPCKDLGELLTTDPNATLQFATKSNPS